MSGAAQARYKIPTLTGRRANQTLTEGCRFFRGNLCPVANVMFLKITPGRVAAHKAGGIRLLDNNAA